MQCTREIVTRPGVESIINNLAMMIPGPGPAGTEPELPTTLSDSLNISPRARWVVCPLGRTRGHGFPAAWPLGQQREGRGDLFIFSLALLAIFW